MTPRPWPILGLLALAATSVVQGQTAPLLRRARAAYDSLDYRAAVALARQALQGRLSRADRVAAYELEGLAFGALDSTLQAQQAFRELIFLDPDREPDSVRVTPRIRALYASALGQVLVVRHLAVEPAQFLAGHGGAPVRFEVSRNAAVTLRITGQGFDFLLDSSVISGAALITLGALRPDGDPLPPGDYHVVVTARDGVNEYAVSVPVRVTHGAVDTLPHLTSLPGYPEQPELARPPRNWRPLGLAALYAGLVGGAALALENTTLDAGSRRELIAVSGLTALAGLLLSVRKPDPQPVPANVLFNRLLHEQLAQRNAEIARQNAQRRRQVLIGVEQLEQVTSPP